jgi:hypothetical protein
VTVIVAVDDWKGLIGVACGTRWLILRSAMNAASLWLPLARNR